jgi:hypothetical protein
MGRIACLIVKDDAGDFRDPITGAKLRCCGDGAEIETLVKEYRRLRDSGGVMKHGKTEVRIAEVRLLANATAGGELKGVARFR